MGSSTCTLYVVCLFLQVITLTFPHKHGPEDESDGVYRTEWIAAAWSSPRIEMDQVPEERGGTEQKKVVLH